MVELQEIRSFKKPPIMGANGSPVFEPAESACSQSANGWRMIIEATLTKWIRDPQQLEDDGLKAPTAEIISLASEFARFCAGHTVDPPLRIVPDGSGGIAFEWKLGAHFAAVELHADGRMEMMHFHDSVLQSRESIG